MINLKIFGNKFFEGKYSFEENITLKEIYKSIGGKKRIKIIQVGGALGKILVDDQINLSLVELENDFVDNSISYFETNLCPVDFKRFMIRFTMRELNIVNDNLRKIYAYVDSMTKGKINKLDFEHYKLLISQKGSIRGEDLLLKNLLFITNYFEEEIFEHVNNKFCRNSICRGLFKAQCINACPAHIHIPGFMELMKANQISDAYKLMRQENPLSSICGSVCARPCELHCRRGQITSTVGVRALQRFISNAAIADWNNEETLLSNGKSICIIGGGPSGVTAGYFLRRTGYDVTIYESNNEAGGMLRFGVPSYRLPAKSIRDEIETIKSLGVKIITNTKVGRDITLDDISNSCDAVLLATGTTKGNTVNIQYDNVISGIEFLKNVRLENKLEVSKKVLVIGGGDVALDCARTSIRLGADAIIVSLESFDEMPASFEEKKQGLDEDVVFISGYGLKHISDRDITLKKCTQVLDDFSRFDPLFNEEIKEIKDVDLIIFAIGQKPELDYIEKSFVNKRGFIKLSDNYNVLNNIYACGDMIRPTIVIDAIAQGKKAAIQIDFNLGGTGLYVGEEIIIPNPVLNIRTFDFDLREEKEINMQLRKKSFEEITKVYEYEDAIYEADRCMRCDRNSQESLLLGK